MRKAAIPSLFVFALASSSVALGCAHRATTSDPPLPYAPDPTFATPRRAPAGPANATGAPTANAAEPGPRIPSPPPASAELRAWEGVWLDPDTAMHTQMTIVLRGNVPTYLRSAESIGDLEVYEPRGSTWQGGRLRFSHFVPSTQYLVTYTCSAPSGSSMPCHWTNDRNASGDVTLKRVGGAPSSQPPPPPPSSDPGTGAWLGIWQDPNTSYKTRMTIVDRGGQPTVTRSAESIGDLEVYEVRSSSWQTGTLRWSHFVPSTQYLVTYTCASVRSDTMSCTWSNDHNRSGSVQLERVGGAPQAVPAPTVGPTPPRTKDDAKD